MGSRHSSGPSSYEIQQQQMKAEKEEAKRLEAENAEKVRQANASSGGEPEAGQGQHVDSMEGALSKAKKKGATLAGEGAQTFGKSGNLGG